MNIYDFTVADIHGNDVSLRQYEGKTLLIVNVASKCGLTPQYAELELLYRELKDKGLVILGFPANNFAGQEPGTNEEILSFCTLNYEVSFPLFAKISVKGEDQHPLYAFLTEAASQPVTWNFQKFLIGRDGQVLQSIIPTDSVNKPEVRQAIEAAL